MIHIKTFKIFTETNESVRVEKMDFVSYDDITVTELPYINHIKDNRNPFLKKITALSRNLGINPLWLMHTIYKESGFDTKIMNNVSGTCGLLSFSPGFLKILINEETGKSLTPNDVINMDSLEQLDIIETYYRTWIDKLKIKSPVSVGDFASMTFYPGVVNKKNDWEFPEYVTEKNKELFDELDQYSKKSKQEYHKYISETLNNDSEYKERDQIKIGNITGAIMNPYDYENKDQEDFYKDLVDSLNDSLWREALEREKEKDKETDI